MYKETINIDGFYYENMFSIYSDSEYNIVDVNNKKLKVYIKNFMATNFKLDLIEVIEDTEYLQRVNVNIENLKELRPLQEYHLATIDFS